MQLRLDCSSKVDSGFINFLIKQIKEYVKSIVDLKRLSVFDKYLSDELGITDTALDIINLALNNLCYKKSSKSYIISINNNTNLQNNVAKLYDVCKLINFGNLQISGYPIFTKTFNYFEKNANIYLSLYR